ncbi:MAG: GDSL-type esterase/lipase family protein [Sedimentisphaeraceae bacterium JB056]
MKVKLVLFLMFFTFAFGNTDQASVKIYLSPAAQGKATGVSVQDAAVYYDSAVWQKVNKMLTSQEVSVILLDGQYNTKQLKLVNIGSNDKKRLTIMGESPDKVVLNAPTATMMSLRGCENITVENLNFTGDISGYGLAITKDSDGNPCKNIEIRACNWYDLPNLYYGCTGASFGSYDITFIKCSFKRAGQDSHHHFIYNAYDAHYVNVIDCHFEDCTGSYVRYRSHSDYGTVTGNTFISTGDYPNYDPNIEVFIAVEHFADVDPGDERFGTHYAFANNSFTFTPAPTEDAIRTGIRFRHAGFDYPGLNCLMTAPEGKILESNNGEIKKKLLLRNCGLDFDKISVINNQWKNEKWKLHFSSFASFGATSKGWEGDVDISEVIKVKPEKASKPIDPCTAEVGVDRLSTPVAKTHLDTWMLQYEEILESIKNSSEGYDLVMIGDSITYRWLTNGKAVWDEYYLPRKTLNLGYDGDRTQYVLWRLDNGELDNIDPKLAILLIGTNNSNTRKNTAEQIANGVMAVICKIREKLPDTKLLVLSILPRADLRQYRDKTDTSNAAMNLHWLKVRRASEIVSQVSDNEKIFFLDVSEAFLDDQGRVSRDYMPDLIHPSEEGYRRWAQAMEPTINKLIRE